MVISIIALLMAILVPVLSAAKKRVVDLNCLHNQKTLVTAWIIYSSDNDDRLVDGDTENSGSWVHPPTNASGTNVGSSSGYTIEDERRGIERGALFAYVKSSKLYHCLADKRDKQPPMSSTERKGLQGGYRSYSVASGFNGEAGPDDTGTITHLSQIKNPAEKYVFVEEDDTRGYNYKCWVLHGTDNPYEFNWVDRVAVFHDKKASLSWADGRATMHTWVDKRTIWGSTMVHDWRDWQMYRAQQYGNEDLKFMKKHYPHLGYAR